MFITRSNQTRNYLAYQDQSDFIPIGANICFVRNDDQKSEQEVFGKFEYWIDQFGSNGGNFMRLWGGMPFFDMGRMDNQEQINRVLFRLDTILGFARRHNIKLKLTLEHFRSIEAQQQPPKEGIISFINTAQHKDNGGAFNTIGEYFKTPEGEAMFLKKATCIANHLKNSTDLCAVELWNEINFLPMHLWLPWTKRMLPQLQKLFPNHFALQSLGSFSGFNAYKMYDEFAEIQDMPILQAHRYLDPGAELDVCKNVPMDVLCADTIRELLRRCPDKPAILAEAGAVEPNHIRYSDLYAIDANGTLLHDILFAPFFAGSAGSGQPWHWDHIYLEKHNLFWHFKRFQKAIQHFSPQQEKPRPFYTETQQLRCYGLKGENQTIVWLRDKSSNWQTQLVQGQQAPVLHNITVPFKPTDGCECYLPWTDETMHISVDRTAITLPDFQRSAVLRFKNY